HRSYPDAKTQQIRLVWLEYSARFEYANWHLPSSQHLIHNHWFETQEPRPCLVRADAHNPRTSEIACSRYYKPILARLPVLQLSYVGHINSTEPRPSSSLSVGSGLGCACCKRCFLAKSNLSSKLALYFNPSGGILVSYNSPHNLRHRLRTGGNCGGYCGIVRPRIRRRSIRRRSHCLIHRGCHLELHLDFPL